MKDWCTPGAVMADPVAMKSTPVVVLPPMRTIWRLKLAIDYIAGSNNS